MSEKTAKCNVIAELYENSGEVGVYFDFGDDHEAAGDFIDVVAKAIEAGTITIGPIKFPPARLVKDADHG